MTECIIYTIKKNIMHNLIYTLKQTNIIYNLYIIKFD